MHSFRGKSFQSEPSVVVFTLILAVLAPLYHVASTLWFPGLPNFSPVLVMAFCCGFVLPRNLAIAVPFLSIFASDIVLNTHYGEPWISVEMVGVYASYAIAVGSGLLLRDQGFMPMIGAVFANSVLFYFITNSLSWIGNPNYPQTFSGWIQSNTVGIPGFPPTWTFFRSSLLSDLLFAVLFFVAIRWLAIKSASFADRGSSPAGV